MPTIPSLFLFLEKGKRKGTVGGELLAAGDVVNGDVEHRSAGKCEDDCFEMLEACCLGETAPSRSQEAPLFSGEFGVDVP